MKLADIFNKELVFNRSDAINRIKELIEKFKIEESQKNGWSNNIIWAETKNSFAIEGENIKASLYTKYLNDNMSSEDKESTFIKFKEAIDQITHSKTKLSEEQIFNYFINLGNASQLNQSKGFDGFYRKGEVILAGTYMYEESGRGLDNPHKYMKYLIEYLNSDDLNDDFGILIKAMIAHIQFANIHPYYDMNGRMARLLNIWVSMNSKYNYIFHFLSQSIHFTKPRYYKAIDATINGDKIYLNNFINYICDAILLNNTCWNKIRPIAKELTNTEKDWAILITSNFDKTEFGWKDLNRNLSTDISKQYLIPMLNKFCDIGLLEKQERKNTFFYKIKK